MERTLEQYLEQYDRVSRTMPTGAVQVFVPTEWRTGEGWDLFHLTDYVVSSAVAGPSYWLVPRTRHNRRIAG